MHFSTLQDTPHVADHLVMRQGTACWELHAVRKYHLVMRQGITCWELIEVAKPASEYKYFKPVQVGTNANESRRRYMARFNPITNVTILRNAIFAFCAHFA